MRLSALALALGTLAPPLAAGALAQPAAPTAIPRWAPSAVPCERQTLALGAVGRASVVSFTGAVFGEAVCATVVNVAGDLITARVLDAPPDDAFAVAGLTGGGGVSLRVGGTAIDDAGPYVVGPGGTFPAAADTTALPRVVLAYAGARVLLIATSPVALVDLTRALRDQPDLFGAADAVERAVVLASGDAAILAVHGPGGNLGAPAVTAPKILALSPAGG